MNTTAKPARRRTARLAAGASIGFVATAAGLGAGELVAAATGPDTSPVVAVGSGVIALTPRVLQEFAVSTFGSGHRPILVAGVVTILAVAAAAAGYIALRRLAAGAALLLALAGIGMAAAAATAQSGATAALPASAAAVISVATLAALTRLTRPRPRAGAEAVNTAQQDGSSAAGADNPLPRRTLLLAGAGTAGAAVAAGLGGRMLQARLFDVADSRAAIALPEPASPAPALPAGHRFAVDGLGPFFTPARDFYRVDTALVIPQVPAQQWSLRIGGSVDRPLEITFEELLERELVERDLTLSCVSNQVGGPYVSTGRWLGFPLDRLLREAGPHGGADQLLSRSQDGMTIGTPLGTVLDGRDALLAVGLNGEPLPARNGFPARMIVPGLYGYTSATKWVVELDVTRFDEVDAYWTERDWDPVGTVKTASRIDVPRPLENLGQGEITVAGVAWAQHRGISTVQVRVDGGDWQDAELSEPVSDDTWRQWLTTVQVTPGSPRIEVRAADGAGDLQPQERVDPFPDGATGWHSVAVTVTE
ncbi:DMSO/TMAO reductase YedYZ, molybdopterin-dependent catalytic subunit [Haloechinothrix alba]|uniref:DMSO/TMAO reductase YedYZ, molybdopterin-dependent catalytic subunit n=1 Tax=Haloechinothrix alba TaxID=664784 RepID=A0A238Y0J9_9PSEU|nr:molybdopterin-dependent oxidoreductase [Haloechinothrix alba]SNR64492.1 DMSO/TMAO reductase YedYZ, molybdopterin-dependent catalytic subunit [Haloechinothrix alba]